MNMKEAEKERDSTPFKRKGGGSRREGHQQEEPKNQKHLQYEKPVRGCLSTCK